MSSLDIAPIDLSLHEALTHISCQTYLDCSHWKTALEPLCLRIKQIADAGALVAGTRYLPRNVAAEIDTLVLLITTHAKATFQEAPPFTAPRVAEMILSPQSLGYTLSSSLHILNFLSALERILSTSSTILDFGLVCEPLVADSKVNGLEQILWVDNDMSVLLEENDNDYDYDCEHALETSKKKHYDMERVGKPMGLKKLDCNYSEITNGTRQAEDSNFMPNESGIKTVKEYTPEPKIQANESQDNISDQRNDRMELEQLNVVNIDETCGNREQDSPKSSTDVLSYHTIEKLLVVKGESEYTFSPEE